MASKITCVAALIDSDAASAWIHRSSGEDMSAKDEEVLMT